ncbi:MAG: diguanylate cyclase domain-containing protein [Acidimicrobiales bacterium]
MKRARGERRDQSFGRLFVTHAALALIPVLVLGAALGLGYRSSAQARGLAEGRAEARLISRTAVEPILDGRPLSEKLTPAELSQLDRLVARAVGDGDILRLRLRDLGGTVVFTSDNSRQRDLDDDEALAAAAGATVARVTRLNADANDTGPLGPVAVEVYQPLQAGSPLHRVGVLEMYLPYAPISADVTNELHSLYEDLAMGLALLYLAILLITLSVSRGLRREVVRNRHLAEHDSLTGLANRELFMSEASAALRSKPHRKVVVAIADIDRFKEVNDTLGHHNGDGLIVQLADRLAREVGDGNTVARLGGDEFGILLTDHVSTATPERTLRRLREVLGREATAGGVPISVETSIGYAMSPEHGDASDGLLQRADIAMYAAKTQHQGVVGYQSSQRQYDAGSLALLTELRHAIGAGELVLHFQPKVRLAVGLDHPGRGVGYAGALGRIPRPLAASARGTVAAGEFLAHRRADRRDLRAHLVGDAVVNGCSR